MSYHQLTEKERHRIEVYLSQGRSKAWIAQSLGKHRSSIYREIKRNSLEMWNEPLPTYDAIPAESITKERRIEACRSRYKVRGNILATLRKGLSEKLSPEQIASSLARENGSWVVSTSSIYRYLIRDARDFSGLELYKALPRYGSKRTRRVPRQRPLGRKRRSFRERPKSCETRSVNGHFERDLMEGKKRSKAVLVMIDRRSRLVRLEFVMRKAEEVHCATKKLMRGLGAKSITNDNGFEFDMARGVEKELGLKIYFTDPGSPWQRGSVENVIGLLRRYFPKHRDLSSITRKELKEIEAKFNHLPRKILKFKTPSEIYYGQKKSRSHPL